MYCGGLHVGFPRMAWQSPRCLHRYKAQMWPLNMVGNRTGEQSRLVSQRVVVCEENIGTSTPPGMESPGIPLARYTQEQPASSTKSFTPMVDLPALIILIRPPKLPELNHKKFSSTHGFKSPGPKPNNHQLSCNLKKHTPMHPRSPLHHLHCKGFLILRSSVLGRLTQTCTTLMQVKATGGSPGGEILGASIPTQKTSRPWIDWRKKKQMP